MNGARYALMQGPGTRDWEWAELPYHLTLIDAEPFRIVIEDLRRTYPLRVIAEACGLSRYTLTLIVNRRRYRIRVDTAEKLRSGLLSLFGAEETA